MDCQDNMRIKDKNLLIASIAIAAVFLLLFSALIRSWIADDAFIAFRYAANLADGNGPVFNTGERVEGYTSFLWMVLMAAGKLLGIKPPVFSVILGIIFALGCIFILSAAHLFIGQINARISAIAVLFLGSSGVFLPWGKSGMEVMAFTFSILLIVLYYIRIKDSGDPRSFILLGTLCAIAMLIRPEGSLLSLAIIISHLFGGRNRWPIFYFVGAVLFLYVPYFCWRYLYYGYFFPNTFYAKVGFSVGQVINGLKYTIKFAFVSLLMLLPLIDPQTISGWLRRLKGLIIIPVVSVLFAVYVILVGGDFMEAFRFFVPILPLICLLTAISLSLFGRWRMTAIFTVAIIVYNLAMWNFEDIIPTFKHDRVAEIGKEVGIWLADNVPPDAVIATNTAGTIPYYSGLRTIDMLGLNDLHIGHHDIPKMGSGWSGHEKGDGDYVLSRSPNLIQMGSSLGTQKPGFRGDHELYDNPVFHKEYILRIIELPSGDTLRIYENIRHPVLAGFDRQSPKDGT